MTSLLFKYQLEAVEKLRTGSILCGGVGSGKSLTALWYYYTKVHANGLYIITTAAKRDSLDWEHENAMLTDLIGIHVDSWNNIKKYVDIKDCFFIFDEQRLIGSGVWVRSFLKIVKHNDWILLSATPGDTWMDYIPVFVANGYYKNRIDFIRQHVVYSPYVKFPKIDRYVGEQRLLDLKEKTLVVMDYQKPTKNIYENLLATYDEKELKTLIKRRWNPYKDKPIRNFSEFIFVMRRIINSDPSRTVLVLKELIKHRKLVVFYNFNYELEILKNIPNIKIAEYNGFKHEPIPTTQTWLYLVQYMSGSEALNIVETNAIVFYSLNYSYRIMTQAAGRIDRLNTPFAKLYYYNIVSDSSIDKAILKAIRNKKIFNEKKFAAKTYPIMEGKSAW